jgi:hypothetical protein
MTINLALELAIFRRRSLPLSPAMTKLPFDPEEDDFLGQTEECYPEETFGDRLRLFYNQFSAATRSLLSDSLFRELSLETGLARLEILCPNQTVQRRLLQKRRKILNEVRWIWPETMVEISLGVKRQPREEVVLHLKQ